MKCIFDDTMDCYLADPKPIHCSQCDLKYLELKSKMNVLFVYRNLPSFIKNDLDIIERNFKTYKLKVNFNIFRAIKNFVKYGLKTKVYYVWFGGFQSLLSLFFAKLFNKKLIVVAGGYDVEEIKEINYGAFCSWYRRFMAKIVFSKCNLVLSVSQHTKKTLDMKIKTKKNILIYNGVDVDKYFNAGEKENIVLTVATINKTNFVKKGLMTFILSSWIVRDMQFIIIGKFEDKNILKLLKAFSGKNVRFMGYVDDETLLKYYQKALIYAQLSLTESFSLSLAEAMSCRCVPLTTKEGALIEVAGLTGFYVPFGCGRKTAKKIQYMRNINLKLKSKKAENRIKKRFTLKQREKKLIEVIKNEL